RVFPALLQDRREVLTAISTSGNPNAWSRVAAAEGKIAMAISFQDAGKFRLKHAEETFSVIRGRARPSRSYNWPAPGLDEDVIYRCKGCHSDVKRTFKQGLGAWELVTGAPI